MKCKKIICAALVAAVVLCSGCSLLRKGGGDMLSKRYANYIKSTLDCSFFGETEEYLKWVDATEAEAQKTYQDTVEGYASLIMYHFEVEESTISEETIAAFQEKAKTYMKEASYSVADAVKNSDNDYSVTVTVKPIDLMASVSYQPIVDWFNETYSQETLDAMSDEEYAVVEEEYAKKILALLDGYTVSYADEVKCTVTILVNESDNTYSVSDADWSSLDENVLGIELD